MSSDTAPAILPVTYDGVPVTLGLRVFTHEWKWGTVTVLDRHPEWAKRVEDLWHEVCYRDDAKPGDGGTLINSERMTTRPPAGAPRDPLAR